MRIVVTGGAGFIGANLVRRLVEQEWIDEVVVLDDLSTGSEENLEGFDIDLRVGSVLDADLLAETFDGADSVVHLAARPSVRRSIAEPLVTYEANATGTVRVLEAVRQNEVPHTIVASSSSVYGRNPALPKHEGLATEPMSPYAASKLAAEGFAHAYSAAFGVDLLAFRFFNVFGPLQPAGHAYAAAIPAFIEAALDHRPLTIFGDGGQTRDFTYIGSVTAVLQAAVERQASAVGPVNLAFGTRRSLLDVVRGLAKVLDRELEVEHLAEQPGDVRHSQADSERLTQLFPDVEQVPFERGLEETVRWFRE